MAKVVSAAKTVIDLDEVFDKALANPKPKGRPLTKMQQLQERREKLIALRSKGYTELELAQMAGVSKDTLRKALHSENGRETKKTRSSDHSAAQKKKDQTEKRTATRVSNVAVVNTEKKPFPTNDRF